MVFDNRIRIINKALIDNKLCLKKKRNSKPKECK